MRVDTRSTKGGSSSYYTHVPSGLSHGAGTSASPRYPNLYYPIERYICYGADQAQRAVEGV
jgi:hypothetical protein